MENKEQRLVTKLTIKQTYVITEEHYICAISMLLCYGEKVTKSNINERIKDSLKFHGEDHPVGDDSFWEQAVELFNKLYKK